MKKTILFLFCILSSVLWADSPEDEFETFQKKYPNSAIKYKKIHAAVESLVKQESRVYDKVLEAAKNHTSVSVRQWSCYSLALMKKEGTAKILAERLQEEKSKTVRSHILDSLVMNKGRDPLVPRVVLDHLNKYQKDLAPQDIELSLTILVSYAAGPHKVAFSDEILKKLDSYVSDLYVRRTLVRLYADEFLYPGMRDNLIYRYVKLGMEARQEDVQGETLLLLMEMARYRRKGKDVSPDYGAWKYLIQMAYHYYTFELFMINIQLFNFENKPLRDLTDHLFSLVPTIKKSQDRKKAQILVKGFEILFTPHKLPETEDKKKGFEREIAELEAWEKHWKSIRSTIPSPPPYDPYTTLTLDKIKEDILFKMAVEQGGVKPKK